MKQFWWEMSAHYKSAATWGSLATNGGRGKGLFFFVIDHKV